MHGEFMFSLDCEPIELADPDARRSIKEFAHELEAVGISNVHHVYFRTGAVMASIGSLGPYLVPIALIAIPALKNVLIAWINAAPGRKIRMQVGDVRIEANSVKDVERLMPLLTELQQNRDGEKPKA